MKLLFTGDTNPGLIRKNNQDSYFSDEQGRFFIVADGMGGHAGGEQASRIATEKIQFCLNEHWNEDLSCEQLLRSAFKQANQCILSDQFNNPERADMGTTAVVFMYRDNQFWCGHVGDSRLYSFRDGQLSQITDDHTWVARALKVGDLTPDQAKNHPWRHVLSQCLGRKDLYNIEIQAMDVKPGDRLLLCSDGLTEEVKDDMIQSCLAQYPNSTETVKQLIQRALDAGGSDNVTIILIDFQEDPE
jgi:PPM family protein phosphatase